MATVIRILVHDTRNLTSLLTHLGVKATARLLTTSPILPADEHTLFQFGMGTMCLGDAASPIHPSLGEYGWAFVSVTDWWTQTIHVFDAGETRVSRKTMVLGAANKQGGAHVDPKLNGAFKRLAEDGAFLHLMQVIDGVEVCRPLLDIHLTNLRDMAFEITHSPDIALLAGGTFPGPCQRCNGADRADSREPYIVRRTTRSVTECHELTCGHRWHVTAANLDGADEPVVYDHPCDCDLGEYDSRVFRMVGLQHPRWAAYSWGKFTALGRGVVVLQEADVRRALDISSDIEIDPIYQIAYCTLEALEGTTLLPASLRENAERVSPAVRAYDPQTGYVIFCKHLEDGAPPTVTTVENIPPLPPDAYAARKPEWREGNPPDPQPPTG